MFFFEKSIFHGYRPPVFFKPFVKRELKKKEAININDPRTVLASPNEHTQLGYRLYAPMNERIMQVPFRTPCYGGITKFHGYWDKLARKLMTFKYIGDGDVSHFDGTIPIDAFNKVRDLRFASSNEKNINYHDFYYFCVVNSLIVGSLGDVFMKKQGQPSGQSNTMIDNSLIHVSYWYYLWCKCVVGSVDGTSCTVESFNEHVFLMVNGDDVVYSYSEAVRPFFKPSFVKDFFFTIGVNFKFTKDNPSIEEVEFNSTFFSLRHGFYVPIPKREKMLASLLLKPKTNPRIVLKRLLAIRVEVWWDDYLRDFINNVVDDFLVDYKYELSQNPTGHDGDDSCLDDILKLRLSAFALHNKFLYEF
jgi:hypothetical protein